MLPRGVGEKPDGAGQEAVADLLRKDPRVSLRKSGPSGKLVLRKDHEGYFRNEPFPKG